MTDQSIHDKLDAILAILSKPKRAYKAKVYAETPLFLLFWRTYPRKVGKAEALKAWHETGVEDSPVSIINAVEQWKAEWLREGRDLKYIPHPATWLRRKDYLSCPSQSVKPELQDSDVFKLVTR
jgi:hypothetical protein